MSAKRLRVLAVGCTPLAAKTIAVVEELSSCELAGVVNLHPEEGRLKSNYDSFSDWAAKNPERMHWTSDINSEATRAWIASRRCDVMIQAGWSQIFRKEVLTLPRLFAMGIHPAPLPKGRGGAVINWRLIEGGGPWGNSLFVMLPSVDAGDVLDTEPFVLEPRDDIRTGHLKVDRTAIKMLRRTLPRIASGSFERRPQDPSQMTKYPRRKPQEGRITPLWPARKWLDYVRALTHPFPGAFLETERGALMVWKAEPGEGSGAPGFLLEISLGRGVKVGSGDTPVWLTLVTPPGDVECWADEWAAEAGLEPGTVLAR
ncbi:MAG: hypothetical protein A3J74_01490 [Elusimicrobia bacterium RIFCSPHIGHO2_02_FULL_57_9]|nr:MAG: hypothetical protein A3J74_01490 [Elusimicrobia bacterium RIFCSPHIGHO2_02_FULL_57_9]